MFSKSQFGHKMKYVFIADFLEIVGGAEASDNNLRNFLGGEQIKMRSADCTTQKLSKLSDYRFIISNFTGLSEDCKQFLIKNCDYICVQHDHQYLKSRNPSIFPNFKAPSEQLINIEFYKSAKSVVCQTQKHLDVMFLNTNLPNLVNFGGSLWSDEELDYIESILSNEEKSKLAAILDSDIIHKGTKESIEYCKKNNKLYLLLPIKEWKQFISDLNLCTELVFFAGVLETCSRMAVEARMLGLKVTTNSLVSAIHEDWFKKYKGLKLINYFREKNKGIKKFIEDCFDKKKDDKQPEITCILNLYRRPDVLQEQIDSLKSQTIPPKEIWVWKNYHEDNKNFDKSKIKGVDKWIESSFNFKYYGRFSVALLAETEYVHLLDCDTIPARKWHENCLNSMKISPGIMGGVGVVLNSEKYDDHVRYGWPNRLDYIKEVDLVGHSWFLTKEHIRNMWSIEPFTFENAEDIHLSAANLKLGIKTYVPPQIDPETLSSIKGYELGVGIQASSHPVNHNKFYFERDMVINKWIKKGWKLVKDRK